MKKILLLSLLFIWVISTGVNAQSGPRSTGETAPDQKTMLREMKEKIAPQMAEKTGLSTAQAEKVIEINFELRNSMMTGMRDLDDAARAQKIADFKAAKEKKYSEIPLTADQIKAVYAFYEDMGKNRSEKRGS